MQEINYDKIQSDLTRPQYLCLHCGKCMPIPDYSGERHSEVLTEESMEDKIFGKDFPPLKAQNETFSVRGPANIWDNFAPECGYAGWIFKEREHQKQLIRKIKEEIYAISFLPPETIVNSKGITALEQIVKLKAQIEPWNKHGAVNW